MKTFLLSIIFLIPSSMLFSQTITIGDDDIVRCVDVPIGTTQTIFGDTYEVVDRALLIQRRDEGADLTKVCVSNVTDMSNMFRNKMEFNQPIGNWDVSNVTDMGSMFSNSGFNQPIDNWNVSNVINMMEMFYNNNKFNQPIGNWDVSKVENMYVMFVSTPFNQPIGSWNVTNVTNMSNMFLGSSFNQPVGNWDVGSVIDLSFMFSFTSFNQPIGNWDVSSVVDMSSMFEGGEFNQPIGNWDVSNVTDMGSMFVSTPFNQSVDDWNVSKVTDASNMFSYSSFNQPIGNWNVSSLIDMRSMFQSNSSFNQPIGNWDVSSVVDMSRTFSQTNFSQDISKWCVPNIESEPLFFATGSPLNPENKPLWGTCPGLPSKLTQLMPLDNSLDISLNPEFKWSKDSLTTSYQFQIFEGFDPIVLDTLVKDTVFSFPSTLEQNIKYNWRVRGVNENRTSNGMPLAGEWSNVWGFTTQTITSNEKENSPNEFVLNQNYPNPFNPTTQIQFSLPKTTHVKIEVYSIMGQQITTLVNGSMSMGSHTASFDGKSFSSGVYIYRLTTPEFTQSRMMNLIK